MAQIELDLGLQPLSAWHIGTGYGLAGVVDATTARAGEGLIYIPGSTIKGRTRYRFRQVMEALNITGCEPDQPCRGPNTLCPICNVFGSIREGGTLFFSDLQMVDDQADLAKLDGGRFQPLFEHAIRTNVMISRPRGVALERHLFTTEVGTPELYLTGDVSGEMMSRGRTLKVGGQTVPQDLALLLAAMGMVTHIGGRKSRGLGRCRLEITDLTVDGNPIDPGGLLKALLT